jgi:hypothetical protein
VNILIGTWPWTLFKFTAQFETLSPDFQNLNIHLPRDLPKHRLRGIFLTKNEARYRIPNENLPRIDRKSTTLVISQ